MVFTTANATSAAEICGGDGHDRIEVFGGENWFGGGTGNETIIGGFGRNGLPANTKDWQSTIFGGGGDDVMRSYSSAFAFVFSLDSDDLEFTLDFRTDTIRNVQPNWDINRLDPADGQTPQIDRAFVGNDWLIIGESHLTGIVPDRWVTRAKVIRQDLAHMFEEELRAEQTAVLGQTA